MKPKWYEIQTCGKATYNFLEELESKYRRMGSLIVSLWRGYSGKVCKVNDKET